MEAFHLSGASGDASQLMSPWLSTSLGPIESHQIEKDRLPHIYHNLPNENV